MKLKRLCPVVMVLGLTITNLAGCSSEKTANSSNGADNPSAITSPQPSNENNQATPSATVKPSTNSQPSSSSGEEAKFYYGTWIIKKYMPTTNVSSLSAILFYVLGQFLGENFKDSRPWRLLMGALSTAKPMDL